MGTYTIAPRHLRFAIKLACAVVLALFVGFHFQLETPRWAVLTAAIVAAGPAFAAGGEPYSGAIRYRGLLHHCRHLYWLYCRTGNHHCDDPSTIIDDSGVPVSGPGFVPGYPRWYEGRKLVCVGGWPVIPR
ncbi:FUSC family protein [Klebsiella pneumoniae]|nr:FUSC family protein [Klebsiella pneumoniae]